MDIALFSQFIVNGLMQGIVYALVALGFTLFFGVLDVIKFSHGDVLTVGAFAGLTSFLAISALGVDNAWLALFIVLLFAVSVTAILGAVVARVLVVPLKRRGRRW